MHNSSGSPIELIIGIVGILIFVCAISLALSIVQIPLGIISWIISLDIPNSIKLAVTNEMIALSFLIIGIPAAIYAKVKRII
jgi:hypothetical protein